MKIAHISSPNYLLSDRYGGGTESVILNLANKQIEEGHEVWVFSAPCTSKHSFQAISFQNVRSNQNWLANWLVDRIWGATHICRSCKFVGSRFDIVHNHLSEEGISFSFMSRTPYLTTLHGTPHTKLPQYAITKSFAITRKTKLVAISRQVYLAFKRFYGNDLVGFVYNGIDLKKYPFIASPKRKHNIQLCFVGRIAPEKGVLEAIEVADLLQHQGRDVSLQITGKYDSRNKSYFSKVISLCSTRPYIECKINATPEEVICSYCCSDALLFPVLWKEPFGLVMVESMACGTPVLAFPHGSVSEIVKNGLNGFICNNVPDMVNATLKTSEISRENCRQTVKEEFTVEKMYRHYMRVYREVIDRA